MAGVLSAQTRVVVPSFAAPQAPPFALAFGVVLALFATSPLWLGAVGLYQYLALEVLIWSLYALGYNLLLGYGGLPSFGHGAFFGVGAYAAGLALKQAEVGLIAGMVTAVAAAAIFGAIVAAFISHRRGIYYALMTIAFGQLAWFVSIKWHSVTGGEDGLLNIPRPPLDLGFVQFSLTSHAALFYFALALFAAIAWALWYLIDTPFGRVLGAVKQNEMRAAYCGHNVWLVKFTVFVMSCAIAGLAGGLFALAQQSAYPNVMSLNNSGYVVMMVLIGGGLVSFWGPVIGAVFFIIARDLLGAYTELWLLWYGLLFMAVVLFKPEGLAGMLQQLRDRVRRRTTDAAA
ncbi:MAG TPA: branched-chain amino acid ABC transporter permease [Burkholderiaceae bacterium]|nr:branched-chain amino acid ABC transporter permease [Burkholderiaceae bacterium]